MKLSRRRFLTIASAACVSGRARGTAYAGSTGFYRWRGIALGAKAQIILDHPDAERIAGMAQAEIARLEQVFSLYRSDSDLMRLNATGTLAAPAFELLDCLAIARRVYHTTEGRFDPTVQPLWRVVAEAAAANRAPDPAALDAARRHIGFDRLRFDSAAITMAPGQALTLNGIAQGYIADRVAALVTAEGIEDILIDTGEIVASGVAMDGAGWPVTIRGEVAPLHLRNRALASSALMGTVLAGTGVGTGGAGRDIGHIFDPRDGAVSPRGATQVSVSAPSAALADGLSTGLSLVSERAEALTLLSKVRGARLERFVAPV